MRASNNKSSTRYKLIFPIFFFRKKKAATKHEKGKSKSKVFKETVLVVLLRVVCSALCGVLSALCIAPLPFYFLSILTWRCLVFLHISCTIDARRRVVRRIFCLFNTSLDLFRKSDFDVIARRNLFCSP